MKLLKDDQMLSSSYFLITEDYHIFATANGGSLSCNHGTLPDNECHADFKVQ